MKLKLHRKRKVQVCDATTDDRSVAAGNKNCQLKNYELQLSMQQPAFSLAQRGRLSKNSSKRFE